MTIVRQVHIIALDSINNDFKITFHHQTLKPNS